MAKKSNDHWAKVYRFAWGILFVVLLVALVCIFLPKCREVQKYQKKKIELTDQKRKKEMDIQQLKKKQQKVKTDPKFVESVARDGARVKEGEVTGVKEPIVKP